MNRKLGGQVDAVAGACGAASRAQDNPQGEGDIRYILICLEE